jgi:hypothetical protein
MRFIGSRHVVTTIIVASCVAVPASVEASDRVVPPTFESDAAQSGWTGASRSTDRTDAAQAGMAGSSRSTDRTDAAQAGTDASDRVTATTAFPPADFRGGDAPVDHPGASRAPTAAPTAIEVVRPERTIVRDVDEELPIILSGTALLLVVASFAMTLVYGRMMPRPGRSH